MQALEKLAHAAPWYYASFSALDRYFRTDTDGPLHVSFEGDLVDLARAVADLDFPGVHFADAATWDGDRRIYFRCIEPGSKLPPQTFRPLNLLYDERRTRYLDPYDDYRSIRGPVLEATTEPHSPLHRLIDAAVALARYPHTLDRELDPIESFPALEPETLKTVLIGVLTGRYAERGVALLKRHGFVDAYLPELSAMDGTQHSKEHHPEGDVWAHSIQTFGYRRSLDLRLTLGLLLHDAGKPTAIPVAGRRFDGHAEIGTRLARRLLRRLEFSENVVEDVAWLVEKHMFPGAIHKLPTFRTERLMSHRLFPLLLELYRCDLESTYRGPEGYYRACKVYRDFLKHNANPFRDADGKKLVRLYVD
ncbi:MAG: HD domain-containing protein [Spirochaetaceae bacterium]|nr:MAG: HD domain-containing protein [Spirochaetaceae bacterium]